MSDTKSSQPMVNRRLQMVIEDIAKKINGAPALNGGFDKMMVIVEHIQEKQDETTKKIDKIYDGLYEPDDGLYARVKTMEDSSNNFTADEKTLNDLNASLKKLADKDAELEEKADTTERLKKIAGEDLEKLESVIKVKTNSFDFLAKITWLLAGGALAAMGKAAWEALFSR